MDNKTLKSITKLMPSHADFFNSLSKSYEAKNNIFAASMGKIRDNSTLYPLPFSLAADSQQYNATMIKWYVDLLTNKSAYISNEAIKFAESHPEFAKVIRKRRDLDNIIEVGRWFEETASAHLYHINNSPCVGVTDELLSALLDTKILQSKIPLSFFKLPYSNFYLDFSKNSIDVPFFNNSVFKGKTLSSKMVGVFCNSTTAYPEDPEYKDLLASNTQGELLLEKGIVSDGEPIHVMYFTLVTDKHPYSTHRAECWFAKLMFSDSCDDINIIDLFLLSMFGTTSENYSGETLETLSSFYRTLSLLVNVVFYTNFNAEDKEAFKSRHDIEIQIKRTKNVKKLKQLKAELKNHRNCDVYIGKQYTLEHTHESNDKTRSPTRPHLRRGHWRKILIGKGRKDFKISWIKPCYVSSTTGKGKEAPTVKLQ